MFESLSDKLQAIFDRLGKRGILTEQDVDAALREVRVALLEADVNFKVAKEFLARVRERAIGAEVHKSLTPGQAVVKIVHEELLRTLGEGGKLDLGGPPPRVIMLVGLQGSGKTTTAAKLALRLRNDGRKPLLVAADTYRPAAIIQLETLGKQINIPVFSEGDKVPPPQIAQHAIQRAIQSALDVVIIDTAGRLQIDEARGGRGQGAHPAGRSVAHRRCHDRPGSREHRRCIQQAGRLDRPDPHQGGWRCARWGGHFDARRHWCADQVPEHR